MTHLFRNERGQTLVEYALILGLAVFASIFAIRVLGVAVAKVFVNSGHPTVPAQLECPNGVRSDGSCA